MKFIHWTIDLWLDGNSLITNFPHGTLTDLYGRFRIMVVKFQKTMSEQDIADWFKATYIYFNTAANNLSIFQSIHQTKLRESTAYTGKFKIMYDKKIKMGRKKNVKMCNIPIKINQNLNFENTNNHSTDDNFKHIYGIVIGPCNNVLDLDAVSAESARNFSTAYHEYAYCGGVVKYEYYDM